MRRLSLLPSRATTSESAVKSLYARAASGWQAGLERIGYTEAYQRLIQRAMQAAPINGPLRVLDVGAGTGALSAAFAHRVTEPCRYDLLDLSPDMLTQAAHNLSVETRTITGAIGSAPIACKTYQRVLCGHAIEHCADPQTALNWIFQRLTPGGQAVFAISKPHWCTALIRWKYGSKAFSPAEVEQMLTNSGFSDIRRCPHDSGPPSRISCGYLALRPD